LIHVQVTVKSSLILEFWIQNGRVRLGGNKRLVFKECFKLDAIIL